MGVFDAALTDLHADADLSSAASFQRPPASAQVCRVILSQPTDVMGSARAGKLVAEILATAITVVPKRDDELTIASVIYIVEDAERDVQGLSYVLTLADRN